MALREQFLRRLSPPKQYDEPMDWPQRKKNLVVLTIAYCAFTSPVAVSVYIPAALEVQKEFHTTQTFVSATVSVYILVIGIVPMFWASLCDYMGRRPIYIISMTIAVFGTVGCILAKSIGLFFFFRILQGLGSSSFIAVGGGTLSDVFYPGERGTAFGLFYLGPLVGPIVGPLVGVLPETSRQRVDGRVVGPPSEEATATTVIVEGIPPLPVSPAPVPSTLEKITIGRPHSSCASEAERTITEESAISGLPSPATASDDPCSAVTSDDDSSIIFHTPTTTITALSSAVKPGAIPSFPLPDSTPHSSKAEIELIEALTLEPVPPPPPPSSLPSSNVQDVSNSEPMPYPNSLIASTASTTTTTGPVSPPSPPKLPTFNPFRPLLCLRHRVNFLAVVFNALGLGGQICLLNTMPISFGTQYHLSEAKIGMSMISLGVGLALGSVIGGRYCDFVVRRWLLQQEKKRNLELMEERRMKSRAAEMRNAAQEQQQQQQQPQEEERWAKSDEHEQSGGSIMEVAHVDQIEEEKEVNEDEEIIQSKVTVATRAPPEIRLRSTTTVLVDSNADKNMAAAAVSCSSFVRGIVGALGGVLALPMMNAMGNGWLYTFWACVALFGFSAIVLLIVRAESWPTHDAPSGLEGQLELSFVLAYGVDTYNTLLREHERIQHREERRERRRRERQATHRQRSGDEEEALPTIAEGSGAIGSAAEVSFPPRPPTPTPTPIAPPPPAHLILASAADQPDDLPPPPLSAAPIPYVPLHARLARRASQASSRSNTSTSTDELSIHSSVSHASSFRGPLPPYSVQPQEGDIGYGWRVVGELPRGGFATAAISSSSPHHAPSPTDANSATTAARTTAAEEQDDAMALGDMSSTSSEQQTHPRDTRIIFAPPALTGRTHRRPGSSRLVRGQGIADQESGRRNAPQFNLPVSPYPNVSNDVRDAFRGVMMTMMARIQLDAQQGAWPPLYVYQPPMDPTQVQQALVTTDNSPTVTAPGLRRPSLAPQATGTGASRRMSLFSTASSSSSSPPPPPPPPLPLPPSPSTTVQPRPLSTLTPIEAEAIPAAEITISVPPPPLEEVIPGNLTVVDSGSPAEQRA
ncbi:hypothetical protein DFQ27_006662 [Actinomortierella ambigua]|uniref:Major facilitator superfamily (MFS) profile domain-containing protein n=1 Tax=Actinomortierella ambigua TaxID=1343610 RepID=A0A9P6QN75_9FUNG|nr:hypothetical protein DFQ27_006662 [Actinomortierella ambigua]